MLIVYNMESGKPGFSTTDRAFPDLAITRLILASCCCVSLQHVNTLSKSEGFVYLPREPQRSVRPGRMKNNYGAILAIYVLGSAILHGSTFCNLENQFENMCKGILCLTTNSVYYSCEISTRCGPNSFKEVTPR